MYKTLQEFTRDGIQITVDVCAEHMPLQDFLDDTCYNIRDLETKVNQGTLDWFSLRVRAHVAGTELARADLGGCLYADCADVLCDGVAEDLVQEVLENARKTVIKIRTQLPEAA